MSHSDQPLVNVIYNFASTLALLEAMGYSRADVARVLRRLSADEAQFLPSGDSFAQEWTAKLDAAAGWLS